MLPDRRDARDTDLTSDATDADLASGVNVALRRFPTEV